ncbi:MAG: hypothetical protein PUB46_10715 [Lachnospiraceae bacterium]|uniref:hypothetical protein n=1 Tax=Roseburia hominis TaxID=301301 RepID=UPI001F39B70D|nr:hypothetical protein [Roseburia hominis]MCI5712481.1 hypothetical protein [Lachnospiraceae bacterium]MDD6170519.1 hypothetical protein [Lachnospiraceae bacterium]MDY4839225.1 hypothetical protein [Lachnospiraceae bacterium]
MSTAKQIIMDELLNISDDIQDEFEVLEGLYKMIKLKQSRQSVNEEGTLTTDEVRAHFERKHEKNGALA